MRMVMVISPLLALLAGCTGAPAADFVRLRDVDPSIRQDMRYAGPHNFVGRPIDGYERGECWLTTPAAQALKAVQDDLRRRGDGLELLVFDCYRPQRAVAHFARWAAAIDDTLTRAEFYPSIDKRDLFRLGYIAERSGHSRGSTVDLTLTGPAARPAQSYQPGQNLVTCTAPYEMRFADGGLDMGTGYDCFDDASAPDSNQVDTTAQANRKILGQAMAQHGFRGLSTEYWHFTLNNEPYPQSYFDFVVR